MTDFDSGKEVSARDPDSREGYCTELTEAAKGKKKKKKPRQPTSRICHRDYDDWAMMTTLEKYHLQLFPLLGPMSK